MNETNMKQKDMKNKIVLVTSLMLLILLFTIPSISAVSQLVGLQGKVTTTAGALVDDGLNLRKEFGVRNEEK